jgi:hypothetical protein
MALYLIAVGGTGMRCLESFVHLCAIGMFADKEIKILTIDTDAANGNKRRAEELVNRYIRIKGDDKASNQTFFSAKLHLTSTVIPCPDGFQNFSAITGLENNEDSRNLANLLFDEKVLKFDLTHGYRAVTHLGSFMMYSSILAMVGRVQQGVNVDDKEVRFRDFILDIAANGANAKVFILGSVFGGTGASSIPIIPLAFEKAIHLGEGPNLKFEAQMGASLITSYFTFNKPNENQLEQQGNQIIANAEYFSLNSQAALQFYNRDITVQKRYKTLYLLGWPEANLSDFGSGGNTITGGTHQENPGHIIELFSAFAAHDFFNKEQTNNEVEYKYKNVAVSADDNLNIDFKAFTEKHIEFKKCMTGFYSIALFSLISHQGMVPDSDGIHMWLEHIRQANQVLPGNSITNDFKLDLTTYFRDFLHSNDPNKKSWLHQMKDSFGGKFLFPEEAFHNLTDLNPGFYLSEVVTEKWAFHRNLLGSLKADSQNVAYDKFVKEFVKSFDENNIKSNGREELLARFFTTITKLLKY